jgi:hypothetical protein
LPYLGYTLNRRHEAFGIGTAAAYTAETGKYLVPGRAGVLFQQGLGGKDLSVIAEPAVFKSGLGKTRDDILKFIGLGKAFDGNYFASPDPEGGYEAGRGYGAVKEYGTGAAPAAQTAAFCAQKAEIGSEYVDEPDVRAGSDNHVFAV